MSKVSVTKEKLDLLANAISAKSKDPLTLTLDEMVEAVDKIPVLQSKSANFTPTSSSQSAIITPDNGYDGLDSVSVFVGATLPVTKVAEATYTVNTTSTSATTVATWSTGKSAIWTSDKILYVSVRDTLGKRIGYFYGTDNFFINIYPQNGSSTTSSSSSLRTILRYQTDGTYASTTATSSTGYGVYADMVYSNGRIRIRSRYNSSNSLTINSKYKVKCYLITPPSPIFE